MPKTPITQSKLVDALWALDERHGGFRTQEAVETILAHLADRLPSLEMEESGDLFRIYEPLTEQYFWPEKPDLTTLNETADKLVADIIVSTGKQPTDLPTFEFSITRDITESARVRVTAATIEQAQRIALRPNFYEDPDKAEFTPDDEGDAKPPYLPAGGVVVVIGQAAPQDDDPSP